MHNKAVQENVAVIRKVYSEHSNANVEEHVMGSHRKLHHLRTS